MANPPAPVRNTYLAFNGVGFSSGKPEAFQAMCGSQPPTPTGGYAQWQTLARPLQDGLTIFQGYNPMALSINIIFGSWASGWAQDDKTGQIIETDIRKLEWMAGQGFQAGPPPIVYMYSFAKGGGESDLIPQQYRGTIHKPVPWIIESGIQWGQAWRNENGFRIWQEATFTVENYLNLSKPPAPDTTTRGGYFVSRPGRDTALLIAGAPSSSSPMVDHRSLANRIKTDPKNNPCKGSRIRLQRKSISWKIKHGVHVWVPQHQGL